MQRSYYLMVWVLVAAITASAQGEAKRLSTRNTPTGRSALALVFGTNGGHAIVAPYGRYVVDSAPLDIADIRLAFEYRSISKRFKDEIEISIQNNAGMAIKRLDFRIDVYDTQRRKQLDTLYVTSTDTLRPDKKSFGHLYVSNFRASGDLFLLFVVTKAELADGTTWENSHSDSIVKDMQRAVEKGELQ